MSYELSDEERALVIRVVQRESHRLHRAAHVAMKTYAAPREHALKLHREADVYSDIAQRLKYG